MINPHYHRQVEVKCNYDDRTVEIYFRRYNSRGGLGRSRLYVLEEHEPSYNRLQHLIIHHPSHTKAPATCTKVYTVVVVHGPSMRYGKTRLRND